MEAGDVHSHGLLGLDDGRMAQTILVKMMPSEGWNSMQRHFREHLSKIESYDDLEELYAELYRREADGKKLGGFNQLEKSDEKIDDEKEEAEEWLEQTWLDVWSPEYGWVQTLQALETKRLREGDDATPQDSSSPRQQRQRQVQRKMWKERCMLAMRS